MILILFLKFGRSLRRQAFYVPGPGGKGREGKGRLWLCLMDGWMDECYDIVV